MEGLAPQLAQAGRDEAAGPVGLVRSARNCVAGARVVRPRRRPTIPVKTQRRIVVLGMDQNS